MDEDAVHDPLPVAVAAALEAADAWHTDDFLAAFAADATVDDGAGRQYRGHEAIRAWSDERFIGRHVRLRVTSVSSAAGGGRVVRVRAMVSADGLARPAATALTFTVGGGLVTSLWIVGRTAGDGSVAGSFR